MKNIHILPTDKPSRLYLTTKEYVFEEVNSMSTDECQNKHIYITNSEEIKKGDWCINPKNNKVMKVGHHGHHGYSSKKIILTTDQDLIKDGVQAIDDEFLEFFVKNPNCERVELSLEETQYGSGIYEYVIYKKEIPKEEPKQETLEEAAENYSKLIPFVDEITTNNSKLDFIAGAKYQQEKSYNELFEWLTTKDYLSDKVDVIQKEFKQFKSK